MVSLFVPSHERQPCRLIQKGQLLTWKTTLSTSPDIQTCPGKRGKRFVSPRKQTNTRVGIVDVFPSILGFPTFLGRLLRMHSASNTCPTVTPSIATAAPLYLRVERGAVDGMSQHGRRTRLHLVLLFFVLVPLMPSLFLHQLC